jgi:hypothetical protein
MNRIYYWSSNFEAMQGLIDELAENDRFLIPRFLLRAQLIEFALKYLLTHAPYKPVKGLGKKSVEDMTMGEVIQKLDECDDSHLSAIIDAATDFKKMRNEITHKLVNSDKSLAEIEALIEQKMLVATEIEKQITFFAEYVEQVLPVHFEEISEHDTGRSAP